MAFGTIILSDFDADCKARCMTSHTAHCLRALPDRTPLHRRHVDKSALPCFPSSRLRFPAPSRPQTTPLRCVAWQLLDRAQNPSQIIQPSTHQDLAAAAAHPGRSIERSAVKSGDMVQRNALSSPLPWNISLPQPPPIVGDSVWLENLLDKQCVLPLGSGALDLCMYISCEVPRLLSRLSCIDRPRIFLPHLVIRRSFVILLSSVLPSPYCQGFCTWLLQPRL